MTAKQRDRCHGENHGAGVSKTKPEPVQEKALALPKEVTRTIRGIVRDEQGRPVAKAWIGTSLRPNPMIRGTGRRALDRIRACNEPFRDEHGTIVPAALLGKYFEMRDEAGKWQPIHPADIHRFKRPASRSRYA